VEKSFDETLSKLEIFFSGTIKSYSEIFSALKKLFYFENGAVYFLSPEALRIEFAYPQNTSGKEIKITETEKNTFYNAEEKLRIDLFKGENTLAERLIVQNCVFGILAVSSNKKFSAIDKRIFKTCTIAISNIIKEIELSKILKMQTKVLQEGIIKTGKAYKITKSQNKKILEADRIKSKFLSNVSHELRTPLNSIIGFSELLQNPATGTLNNRQIEFVKDIQTAGIHLLGMINEILDLSKIEADAMKLKVKTFEISQCIEETLNILKPLYKKKNISVSKNIRNSLITADYQKVQQILFNLINNAIKFTQNNGNIEITAKAKRKFIEIRIKDDGCGIEKKYHRKIFKKFEQASQSENSTGLGLTITKELVQLHGGCIKLKSELEKGTEFIVNLPVSVAGYI